MRTLLKVLSLTFSIGVLAALTTNAARGSDGCSSPPSNPPATQVAPPAQNAQAAAPAQTAPAETAKPANPKAAAVGAEREPSVPIDDNSPSRFIGASKAGPVFLPREVSPKKKAPEQQQQQAQ